MIGQLDQRATAAGVAPFPTDFELCLRRVLMYEGEWSDHPDDPGGLTRWGISQARYPDLDLRSLTMDDVAAIYFRDYWEPSRAGELPKGLQLMHFDSAVNLGPRRAGRLLQKAIGDIEVDGIVGPITIGEAHKKPVHQTLRRYGAERLDYYTTRHNWAVFGRGWTRRVADILRQPYPVQEGEW